MDPRNDFSPHCLPIQGLTVAVIFLKIVTICHVTTQLEKIPVMVPQISLLAEKHLHNRRSFRDPKVVLPLVMAWMWIHPEKTEDVNLQSICSQWKSWLWTGVSVCSWWGCVSLEGGRWTIWEWPWTQSCARMMRGGHNDRSTLAWVYPVCQFDHSCPCLGHIVVGPLCCTQRGADCCAWFRMLPLDWCLMTAAVDFNLAGGGHESSCWGVLAIASLSTFVGTT